MIKKNIRMTRIMKRLFNDNISNDIFISRIRKIITTMSNTQMTKGYGVEDNEDIKDDNISNDKFV